MALAGLCIMPSFAQRVHQTESPYQKHTIRVGHLLDSAYKKFNIYTEASFGRVGGLFSAWPSYMNNGRSLVIPLELNFKAGFFPAKKLLVGIDFSPQLLITNRGVEGFRWSAGPFIRYYFPVYTVRKGYLRSPVAFYVLFQYHLGQYNPMIVGAQFNKQFTHGFSAGAGLSIKLRQNLCLNIEFGPRYDFFSQGYEDRRLSYFFRVGLNYSFSTKREKQERKLEKMKRNLGN